MKKLIPAITFLVLITSAQVNAQVKKDECSREGLLEKTFSHMKSDEPIIKISSSSTNDSIIADSNTLSLSTYKVYNTKSCTLTEYTRKQKKCKKIPQDEIQSGQGNDVFIKITNSTIHYRERMRAVLINLEFSNLKTKEARNKDAETLVEALTIAADNQIGSELSWERIKQEVSYLVISNIVSQELYNDAFTNNSRKNQLALGFLKKYADAQVIEGTGNSDFEDLFDTRIVLISRMEIVSDVFHHIRLNRRQERILARGFEDYGIDFNAPKNWNEVKAMLKYITDNSRDLGNTMYNEMVFDFEKETRKTLGFDIFAQVCNTRIITDDYYKVVAGTAQKTDKTKRISYSISASGLNLIKGERETIKVKLSLLSNPALISQGTFHRLTLFTRGILKNSVKLVIKAERVKKNVSNSLSVTNFTRKRKSNEITFTVVDTAHDQKIGGNSFLHIRVIEDKFFGKNVENPENKRVIKLDANGAATITMNVKMTKSKRKIFIKYALERKGSKYFNDGSSNNDRTKKLRRR